MLLHNASQREKEGCSSLNEKVGAPRMRLFYHCYPSFNVRHALSNKIKR
jgi:hypothetical protein